MTRSQLARRAFPHQSAALLGVTLTGIPQVLQALPKAATDLGKVKMTAIRTAQIMALCLQPGRDRNGFRTIRTGEAFARQGIVNHILAMKPLLVRQDPLLVEIHWSRPMEAGPGIGSAAGSFTSAIAGWDSAGRFG